MARLDAYKSKRDFSRTAEPAPKSRRHLSREAPRFVIQHHSARSDHYDVRLEIDGALKSWAVPKGPSTDPRVKRLAVPTEDHPMEYADFEGTIPEGEYGAGTVMIWDEGSYENVTEKAGRIRPTGEAYERGHILVRLNGRKLAGGYAFQRTGPPGANWLMIKMKDTGADARRNPVSTQTTSARTGRSMREIERAAADA